MLGELATKYAMLDNWVISYFFLAQVLSERTCILFCSSAFQAWRMYIYVWTQVLALLFLVLKIVQHSSWASDELNCWRVKLCQRYTGYQELPDGMDDVTSLERLKIWKCPGIEGFQHGLLQRLPAPKSLYRYSAALSCKDVAEKILAESLETRECSTFWMQSSQLNIVVPRTLLLQNFHCPSWILTRGGRNVDANSSRSSRSAKHRNWILQAMMLKLHIAGKELDWLSWSAGAIRIFCTILLACSKLPQETIVQRRQ